MGRTGAIDVEGSADGWPSLAGQRSSRERGERRVAWMFGVVVAVLTFGAGYRNAELLAVVDEPVYRFVTSHRSGILTDLMRGFTMLGHQNVIIPVTVLFGVVAWRRCRPLVVLLAVATVARVVIHLGLKDTLVRSRPPTGDALISAVGNSFPSGHAISAVLIWGLLPLIVGLYTRRRWVRNAAGVLVATAIGMSTVSRFYLGVHWFTDAVAGLLIGCILLIVVGLSVRMSVAESAGDRWLRPVWQARLARLARLLPGGTRQTG